MRRLIIVAAAALLVVALVPIADAAVSRASMTVEGNVIVTPADPPADPVAMFRFEIRTTETGKVEFGYFETLAFSGVWRTQATIQTVTFFTASNGGRSAEITATECGQYTGENPNAAWSCSSEVVIQFTDNAGKGVPDTICGGTTTNHCLYPFTVTSGDIRIFQRQ